MPIVVQGFSGIAAEVDGSTFRALRTVNRPLDYGSLGAYQYAAESGAIAAGMAANGELLQARWTDATRFLVVHKCTCTGMRATTAFAVGAITIKSIIARAWSADGSGGTAATLSGNNQKMRSSMGTSLMGALRIASTAALGGGTKTLDSNDIGQIVTHSSAGVGGATPIIGSIFLPIYDLFEQDIADGEHPIVLVASEGFVARGTVPATGVWNIGFMLKWAELAAF